MAKPTFLSDGSTPRRTDSRWFILAKWLGMVQDNVTTVHPENDPRKSDTRRILLAKTNAALDGTPWAG